MWRSKRFGFGAQLLRQFPSRRPQPADTAPTTSDAFEERHHNGNEEAALDGQREEPAPSDVSPTRPAVPAIKMLRRGEGLKRFAPPRSAEAASPPPLTSSPIPVKAPTRSKPSGPLKPEHSTVPSVTSKVAAPPAPRIRIIEAPHTELAPLPSTLLNLLQPRHEDASLLEYALQTHEGDTPGTSNVRGSYRCLFENSEAAQRVLRQSLPGRVAGATRTYHEHGAFTHFINGLVGLL